TWLCVRVRVQPYERFALASQLRRAAVSVPLKIAEGHGRKYLGDNKRSISHACGSCAEIDTLLLLACDLRYLAPADVTGAMSLTDETSRMLHRLFAALDARGRAEYPESKRAATKLPPSLTSNTCPKRFTLLKNTQIQVLPGIPLHIQRQRIQPRHESPQVRVQSRVV